MEFRWKSYFKRIGYKSEEQIGAVLHTNNKPQGGLVTDSPRL